MTKHFQRALSGFTNCIRADRIDRLDRKLEQERIDGELERRRHKNAADSDRVLSQWIDRTLRPNAFLTVVMPFLAGCGQSDRRVRDHQFYLNLWTRKAERALWGPSSLRIANYEDRPVFLFVRETIRQDLATGKSTKLNHFHAVCRLPARQMLIERAGGELTIDQRCALFQRTMVAASKTTPEPYARKQAFDKLRGADIQIQPYRPEHARYIFKQLRPRFRLHWTESLDGPLRQDHGLFVLPHLRHRSTRLMT